MRKNSLRLLSMLLSTALLAGCDNGKPGTYVRYKIPRTPASDHRVAIEMPPNAPFISQQFFPNNERGNSGHNGVDFWGKLRTPILAAAPGRVVASFYEPMYGNRIVIDHGIDTNGDHVETVYKHLKERLADVGDVVSRGQQIATMGATGALGMMVHLHFEVERAGADGRFLAHDPQLYWINGPGKVTCFEAGTHYPDRPFRTTLPVVCR